MSDLPGSRAESSISAWATTDAASLREVLEENLQQSGALAALRKDWELGRWERLAAVDLDAFNDLRTIQSAALIAAVANQQLGDHDRVRELTKRALSAGASRALAVSVLVSGVHNILGRARSVAGDQEAAETQFRHSVAIGSDSGRRALAAAARAGEQASQLGLQRAGNGELEFPNRAQDKQISRPSDENAQATDPAPLYLEAPRILVEREASPFVLLDSKSLPRSGIHYLKAELRRTLGDQFSFCEWYHEPGCCRTQPCRLTGFLSHQYNNSARPSVRLIKSHDFDLDDRVVPSSFSMRRLILKRDPLYVLTSWFALDQLSAYHECLGQAGIHMEKIWLNHEPEVLSMAYNVLDENFQPPKSEELEAWLEARTRYIRAFNEKWVESRSLTAASFTYVVDYVELSDFSRWLLSDLDIQREHRSGRSDSKLPAKNEASQFQPREDPFAVKSSAISAYIRDKSDRFRRYATHAGQSHACVSTR